jgi:3-hydroxyisobutyrate dehydrogenase
MAAGSTWAQMATIGLEGIRQAADLATTRPEVTLLDAPVSGSKTAALAGKLVVLASGNRELANPGAMRLFSSLAQQTHWLGPVGAGTRMKLLLNAWIAVLNEGVAEIMGLADVLGVEPKAFTGVVAGGPLVPSWALAKVEKIAQRRTEETEFPLKWADKDVRLALDAAGEAARARLPILNDIANVWATALDEFGADDLSAVYEALACRVISADGTHVQT